MNLGEQDIFTKKFSEARVYNSCEGASRSIKRNNLTDVQVVCFSVIGEVA